MTTKITTPDTENLNKYQRYEVRAIVEKVQVLLDHLERITGVTMEVAPIKQSTPTKDDTDDRHEQPAPKRGRKPRE